MAQKPTEATMSTAAVSTAGQVGIVEFRAILIVAGVSGRGKTTIATALAQRLGLPFTEGSQLHPPPDIARIHSTDPLDDREQWSWLEKIATWIDGRRQLGTGGVITSPALKRSHRDFLTRGRPDVRIVYLHGERALIASRLAARKENSMLASLLDLQLSILEAPEPDEDSILIDVNRPWKTLLRRFCLTSLRRCARIHWTSWPGIAASDPLPRLSHRVGRRRTQADVYGELIDAIHQGRTL